MKRSRLKFLPSLWLISAAAFADPIHAIADGGYWHHDSGWVFPEKIGAFVRVGVPQDVAGSRDAVAYFARGDGDSRMVASVDVYPADSASSGTTLEAAKAAFERDLAEAAERTAEESLAVGVDSSLKVTRVIYANTEPGSSLKILYFVAKGEWRVQIKLTTPAADASALALLDAFVRAQQWETLASG